MEALFLVLVIGTSIWVYLDAQSLGVRKGQLKGLFDLSPIGWFLGSLCLWIIAFPAYLVKRNEYKALKDKARAESNHE